MFAGYVYMYTLLQYWLPQCILDVVSSVFSVVLDWGEHWVYALACSLLHVRWLPLESDDQKSSARWCKVCSYVLPVFFCTSLVVRCGRAIGNCCHWKSLQDYSSFDPPLWCFWWALLPGPDQPQTRWILPGRPIHSGGAVMSCDACAGGSWGFNFTVVTQGTALAYFIHLYTKNHKPCQNILEIFWDTALMFWTPSLAAMATPWSTAEKMKLS